jgi:hypothetical protein
MDPYNKSAVGSYMDNTDYINAYLDTSISPNQILHIRRGTDWAKCPDGYITIRYTKSTDTPGSGTWTTYGSYAHHYSTDEHVIGIWIDGKPLYERIFNLTSGITIGDYTNIALDTTTNKIKNLDGYIERSNGAIDKINGYIQSDDTSRMAIRADKIEVYISSDFTGVSELWVIIQYTKTTD